MGVMLLKGFKVRKTLLLTGLLVAAFPAQGQWLEVDSNGDVTTNTDVNVELPKLDQQIQEAVTNALGTSTKWSQEYDKFIKENLADHVISNLKAPYEEHPWRNGRNIEFSKSDWSADSVNAVGKPAGSPAPPEGDIKAPPGRDSSAASWETFHECFEPRLKKQSCEYCQPKIVYPFDDCKPRKNPGEIWEYWWPEWEVDVNNFGISAVNPADPELFKRPELSTASLVQRKDAGFYPAYTANVAETGAILGVQGSVSNIDNIFSGGVGELGKGQSHTGGLIPNDQCQTFEDHIYRPKVTASNYTWPKSRSGHGAKGCWFRRTPRGCIGKPYWWNGYIWKNNIDCFLDSIPDKPVKNSEMEKKFRPVAWSEEYPEYAKFWRQSIMTQFVDEEKYILGENPYGTGVLQFGSGVENKCLACRQKLWPESLFPSSGIMQNVLAGAVQSGGGSECEQCYYNGSVLWPPTNTLCGFHHPLTSAAVSARKFLDLVQEMREKYPTKYNWPRHNSAYVPHVGVPIFTDFSGKDPGATKNYIDKLQMVFPKVGRCFRMNPSDEGEISSKDTSLSSAGNSMGNKVPWVWELNHAEFPADLNQSSHLGSVRFMFWNRRTACTCQYRSIIEDNLPGKKKGWGCQAYNAFGKDKWRDQGDEPYPGKDKMYGTKRLGFPADFPHACSAYQIWPFYMFKSPLTKAYRKKCEKIWGPVGTDRGCGKIPNINQGSNQPGQGGKPSNDIFPQNPIEVLQGWTGDSATGK